MEQLTVNRFDGSLTDNFIGASPSAWERADNLIITDDVKLKTRPGRQVVYTSSTDARVDLSTANTRRVSALIPYTTTSSTNSFLRQAGERVFVDSSGLTEVVGPASDHALNSITSSEHLCAFTVWRGHTLICSDQYQKPITIFPSSSIRLVTSGLPRPPNTTGATFKDLTESAVTYPYILAFVYKYTYSVNGVQFVHRSAPRYMRRAAAGTTPTHDVTAGQLADFDLANASNQEHYDVASAFGTLKIEYYRTTNAGTVLYYVGESSNGTLATITEVTDANLVKNEPLYTTGGVAENYRPPKCKFVHVTGDFAYYANGKDVLVTSDTDGETLTNRIWQSKPGDIDSVPASFNVDADEEVIGISSARGTPVVFTEKAIYRIDNNFDEYGRGGMQLAKIADFSGGVGHLNCVQTLDKLYFAGVDGFYETDGYQVRNLAEDFIETYKSLTTTTLKKRRIYGTYDDRNKVVLWAMNVHTDETSDNNAIFVYKVTADAFTTWSSGFNIERGTANRYTPLSGNFQPTSLLVQDGVIYMGDANGYTFKFTLDIRTDPKIDTTISDVTDWSSVAIVYDYISSSWDNNLPAIRKYGTKIVVKVNPIFGGTGSNTTLTVSTDTDNSRFFLDSAEIYTNSLIFWGDPTLTWGDSEIYWNSGNKVSQHGRRFPARKLRYSYRKIGMTNAFVALLKSDDLGTCTIVDNGPTATITLTSGGSFFLSDPVGYFMSFGVDGYELEYEITAATSTTITISKNAGNLPSQTLAEWVMRGFRKEDILVLLEWSCYFIPLGDTYGQFRGVTGENG